MESKQDLRIIKTTMALQESFLTLLKEKTFEEITVGEICDRAMVRRATFYNHYSDKYDFLEKFMHQKSDLFQAELAAQHQAENMVDLNTNMFLKFIDFIEEQNFPTNIVSNHLLSTLMPILTDTIQDNIEQNLVVFEQRDVVLPVHRDIISNFCAGGIIQLCRSWFLQSREMNRETLVKEYHKLISYFFSSIPPEDSNPK